MPIKPVRSDRATLNALLTCGELTGSEKQAFQAMYDDLLNGKIVGLSRKQRIWADAVYEKNKLGELRAQARKEARVKEKASQTSLLDTLPKPLKPPTKKTAA